MSIYQITFSITTTAKCKVMADNEKQAREKLIRQFDNGDINYNDYVDSDITIGEVEIYERGEI